MIISKKANEMWYFVDENEVIIQEIGYYARNYFKKRKYNLIINKEKKYTNLYKVSRGSDKRR